MRWIAEIRAGDATGNKPWEERQIIHCKGFIFRRSAVNYIARMSYGLFPLINGQRLYDGTVYRIEK
jgi:hypothetical protein